MSETETTPADTQPADPAPTAQETDWKAEARKWEARAKENSGAAARLAEIEEASKTEAQKAAERLAAAEAKVADYETREQLAAWRTEISKETGLPLDVVAALAGVTREQIAAQAAAIAPHITAPAKPQPIPAVGTGSAMPLNGDGIESALKSAVGIS